MNHNKTKQNGFTLIELLITVAVVAILSAIAYPSYTQHLRQAHRADAESHLMALASRQQQYLLDTRAYADNVTALNVPLPQNVAAHYDVSLTLGTGAVPAFTLSAAPRNGQTADPCGTLTLDNMGIKSPANCW
jgi:type IV pilus assembly protein PilE